MFLSEALNSTYDAPATYPSQHEPSLLGSFHTHFSTVDADRPPFVGAAYRLRYQIYCIEKQFEDLNAHPNELERDEFDSHAVQGLLLHKATGIALGTARLVLPLSNDPARSFAIHRHVDEETLKHAASVPVGSTAEVSRFSISKQSLRRVSNTMADGSDMDYRSGPLMRLGLLQMLIRMSALNGITHWYGIIEPSLMRMMAAMAFYVEPIGPMVSYHGTRQPCFCNLSKVLAEVKCERPSFWEVLTDGGKYAFG
jgi:N-acyl amino acid synthase of PEP-CTERM/exosortase system